ncbi:MAG: T9SS type A sorting domain-containing protein [Bacteroidales bacterium]|nr:T9SS type A sorting domain-containing protein [Bacteroidales bacterium]
MKTLLTSILAIIFVVSVSGQEIKQQVISSAGGYDVSGGISLSWTLGELVITTVESGGGDLILTQGFQQSKLEVTAIEENPDLGVAVTIYPNPTSEILNIKFALPLEGETLVQLAGPDGRSVFSKEVPSGVLIEQINMQAYPAGTYFLRIQNGIKLTVYKIIKL